MTLNKSFKVFIAVLMTMVFIGTANAQETSSAPAKKKSDDKLKIGGRVQFRTVSGQKEASDGTTGNKDYDLMDMNFRRVRLNAKYEQGIFGAFIDMQLGSALNKDKTPLLEANAWAKLPFLNSKLIFGQFKMPFIREEMNSSGRMMIVEKSYGGDKFNEQYDVGYMLHMQPIKNQLHVYIALVNGDGDASGAKKGEMTKTDGSASQAVWRIQYNMVNGKWKDGNEAFSKDMSLVIGYAGLYTEKNETAWESNKGVSADGKDQSVIGTTVDVVFSMMHVYFNASVAMYSGEAATDSKPLTYQATLGYNINLGSFWLMPIYRYDYAGYDYKALDKTYTAARTAHWIGMNFFFKKHDMKAQLFYNINADDNGQSGDANKDPKDDMIYFQLTYNFGKSI